MINWLTVIQFCIIIVFIILFYITFIKNSSSEKIVRGLIGLGILWGLSFLLPIVHLNILGTFVHYIALFLSLSLIVIFQPELRKLLALMGNMKGLRSIIKVFVQTENKSSRIRIAIEEICKAVGYMSEKHTGALIVFPVDTTEMMIERKGIYLDACVSCELLLTIFFNKTPLHDGAVIISKDRIEYAGAILPLSQNQLHWKYGTRHRAALGISEVSNSIVLIVSEETGDISIAEHGTIKKYEDIKKVANKLTKILDK